VVRGLTKTSIPTTTRRFSGGVDLALRRHRGMFSNRAQRIPGQLRERSSKKVRPCALCQPRDELRLDLGVLPLPPTRGSTDTRSDSGDQQCRPCHTKLSRQKSDGTCTRPLRALVWVRHHSVDGDLEIESRALKIAALLERPRSPTRPQIRHRISPSSSRPRSAHPPKAFARSVAGSRVGYACIRPSDHSRCEAPAPISDAAGNCATTQPLPSPRAPGLSRHCTRLLTSLESIHGHTA